jgi:VWFA-related protein
MAAVLAAASIVAAAGTTAVLVAQAAQRAMYVTVLDKEGKPVPDLGPADFIVREDSVAREVLRVEPATEPMQIALLVDNSAAAEPHIRDYREALPPFIAEMTDAAGPKNQMSLIALAERPTILTEYTSDAAVLQKGVNRLFSMSGSGTYLLDALIETSQGIMKRNARRPVIVAITTEGPELSDRVYQQVLEPLRESGAAFHLVVVGRPRNLSHDRSVALDLGTRDSGGRYDNILIGNALPAKMVEVARELKSQYRVTYARPQTLIPPERVTVTAAKPDLKARGTVALDDREVKNR